MFHLHLMKWWKLMKLDATLLEILYLVRINKWDLSDPASIALSFISEESVKVNFKNFCWLCTTKCVCLQIRTNHCSYLFGFDFLCSYKYCENEAWCTIRVYGRMWPGLSISCFTHMQSELSEMKTWDYKLESDSVESQFWLNHSYFWNKII